MWAGHIARHLGLCVEKQKKREGGGVRGKRMLMVLAPMELEYIPPLVYTPPPPPFIPPTLSTLNLSPATYLALASRGKG